MQLTPHFFLEEFTISQTAARKNINNAPNDAAMKNLQRLAETLEKVRSILNNHPILISSGYRSPKLNKAIGGVSDSLHVHGLAVDFTSPYFGTARDICEELEGHMVDLGIDQLILEYDTWVHLGLSASKPRHMTLTINKNGTHNGFV